MDSNRFENAARNIGDKVQDVAGNFMQDAPGRLSEAADRAQEAYGEAFRALFETLDWLEMRLGGQRFLCGERLTEADWRLFTTLIRFDPVYFGHFKRNLREIKDYPALQRYLRELYHWPGVAETVDFFHIKHHYYASHLRINPTSIVPLGPEIDL